MKLKTVDLSRKYQMGSNEIIALNQINLEIEMADFVVISGPSGSGKSTLLNLLGLNDFPTSGKVFINDLDSSLLSGKERRRTRLSHIGFIFQNFNLLSILTACENVELPMALAGISQNEQRKRALGLLEEVGLSERIFHRPKELSMGEMQRVAIARALANEPEIIIADEPTGELDSKTAKEIVELLISVNRKQGTTVIIATHDKGIVRTGKKVYELKDGKI